MEQPTAETLDTARVEHVADLIKNLTVIECVELRKKLENDLGIKARDSSVPVSLDLKETQPIEEQTEFDVTLIEVGAEKVKTIKVVRETTQLGLKESKDLTDSLPKPIAKAVSKQHANEIRLKFEQVGAKVTIS